MDSNTFLLVLVIAIVIGLLPAAIASSKGHDFIVWWLFGAALFIVALPMSIIVSPGGSKKKCPFCAEPIRVEAKVCPHCQRDLLASAAPPEPIVQLLASLGIKNQTELPDKLNAMSNAQLLTIIGEYHLDPQNYSARWKRSDIIALIEQGAGKALAPGHQANGG